MKEEIASALQITPIFGRCLGNVVASVMPSRKDEEVWVFDLHVLLFGP